VRTGIRIPPCSTATDVARCVVDAERAGFDIAWVPDSQFLWRDVWACMALAAERTSRIVLGTCVTNFETRHPSVTAMAAVTLEELAPGRTILGIGSGDSAVKTLGRRPTRLAQLREGIECVRAWTAGETVAFGDRELRLHAPRPMPIYLAGNGPKVVALAGEVADGVITTAGLGPDSVGQVRRRVGRRADEVEICFGVLCHITDDEREAARVVKPFVVAEAQAGRGERLHAIGIDIDPSAVVDGVYPDMSHAEDWEAAADAAEEWVTDEMALRYADAYCVVGTTEQCLARLARAAEEGAHNVFIRHFGSYTLPDDLLAAFGDAIIPSLQ
jgi:5,10-methylenetetrahydromethanopterin reductase